MTKTRRAGFSKKRRRGGRKTVKRRAGRRRSRRRKGGILLPIILAIKHATGGFDIPASSASRTRRWPPRRR